MIYYKLNILRRTTMEQNRNFWSILKIFTITFIYPKFKRPSKLNSCYSWFTSRPGFYYNTYRMTCDLPLNPEFSSISRDYNNFTYVNLVWMDALSCRISREWKFWFCSRYSLVCNRFKVLTVWLESAPEGNFLISNLLK